jgi:hypothetical protein
MKEENKQQVEQVKNVIFIWLIFFLFSKFCVCQADFADNFKSQHCLSNSSNGKLCFI